MRFRWLRKFRKLLRLLGGRSMRGLEGRCSHILTVFMRLYNSEQSYLMKSVQVLVGRLDKCCFEYIKVVTGDGLLEFIHEVRDDATRWS